jgi:hypothetical protein
VRGTDGREKGEGRREKGEKRVSPVNTPSGSKTAAPSRHNNV